MAEHVCPVWVGHLLANPVRKLFQNPRKIFKPYIETGMTVLDIGSAMGFFSLPAAKMVGETGTVVCVDIQEGMIKALEKRAKRAGVLDRILTRVCFEDSLKIDDFKNRIDFAYAIAVIHEVPAKTNLIEEIYNALKPDHHFFVAEPKGHVSNKDFAETIQIIKNAGFTLLDQSKAMMNWQAVFKK
jgi:ubiquinone/menaquinone biosynthesis C-methylase UbiE